MTKSKTDNLIKLGDTLFVSPNIATSKTAAFGSNGSGKTYMVGKLNEELLSRGGWVIILDPVGIHWGLRLDESGKKPSGINIPIFGGQHGDVSLPSNSGAAIADLLTEKRMSAVLDVSEFVDDELDEFCIAFANRFFMNMKKNPRAVLLELEEAQEFIPNTPESKTGVKKTHAFNRIAKIGRNYGIGILLVSPRPQDISTKVVNLTQTLFAFQMTGTHERKRIADWCNYVHLDFDLSKILPTLERGQPFVASPSYLKFTKTTRIGRKHTYDSSSTPEFEEEAASLVSLSNIDITNIEESLGRVLQSHRENDPEYLKAEIFRLRRELEKKPVPQVTATETKVQIVEKPVFREGELSGLADIILAVNQIGGHITGEIANLQESHKAFTAEAERLEKIVRDAKAIQSQVPTSKVFPKLPTPPRASMENQRPTLSKQLATSKPDETGELTGPQRKILNALAWFETIGQASPLKKAVAILAGYSPNGGGFTGPLSRLSTMGLIKYESDSRMTLTADGRGYATYPDSALSVQDIQSQVLSILDGPGKRILRPLLEVYPDSMSKVDLATAAGYKADAGGFTGPLSRLRTMGIIDYPESGKAIAESFLFLS